MKRRFLLAGLAYVVPTFALGYLWHLRLFGQVYDRLEIYRSDLIIPFGFIAILLQGLAVAWAYPRLVAVPERLGSALRFAVCAALISWTFTTLSVGAKHRMTSVPDFLMIETAFTLTQYALVAPLLALAFRSRVHGVR